MTLIDSFHEFYKELLAVNAQLDAGTMSSADAHTQLARKLNGQEWQAERDSGADGRAKFHRAKYAMAALADEMLLNPEHAHTHAESWETHLLERELFHMQRAGEKIFDDVDAMPNLGAAAADLARVYLAVLGLGLQGKFRNPGSGSKDDVARAEELKKELKRCREKLYSLACGADADAEKVQRRAVRAAYEPTITDSHGGKLPHLRPWIYAMVLLVLLYIGGGFALWQHFTSDLAPKVQAINNIQVRGAGKAAP